VAVRAAVGSRYRFRGLGRGVDSTDGQDSSRSRERVGYTRSQTPELASRAVPETRDREAHALGRHAGDDGSGKAGAGLTCPFSAD